MAHRTGLPALLYRGTEVPKEGDFSSTFRGCRWRGVAWEPGLLPMNVLWRAHQCPLMYSWELTISQLFYGPGSVSHVPAGLVLYR